MIDREELTITEHNVETGEVVNRPATEEEKDLYFLSREENMQKELNRAKEQEVLEVKKQELLDKIGLTKEQFNLLVGAQSE